MKMETGRKYCEPSVRMASEAEVTEIVITCPRNGRASRPIVTTEEHATGVPGLRCFAVYVTIWDDQSPSGDLSLATGGCLGQPQPAPQGSTILPRVGPALIREAEGANVSGCSEPAVPAKAIDGTSGQTADRLESIAGAALMQSSESMSTKSDSQSTPGGLERLATAKSTSSAPCPLCNDQAYPVKWAGNNWSAVQRVKQFYNHLGEREVAPVEFVVDSNPCNGVVVSKLHCTMAQDMFDCMPVEVRALEGLDGPLPRKQLELAVYKWVEKVHKRSPVCGYAPDADKEWEAVLAPELVLKHGVVIPGALCGAQALLRCLEGMRPGAALSQLTRAYNDVASLRDDTCMNFSSAITVAEMLDLLASLSLRIDVCMAYVARPNLNVDEDDEFSVIRCDYIIGFAPYGPVYGSRERMVLLPAIGTAVYPHWALVRPAQVGLRTTWRDRPYPIARQEGEATETHNTLFTTSLPIEEAIANLPQFNEDELALANASLNPSWGVTAEERMLMNLAESVFEGVRVILDEETGEFAAIEAQFLMEMEGGRGIPCFSSRSAYQLPEDAPHAAIFRSVAAKEVLGARFYVGPHPPPQIAPGSHWCSLGSAVAADTHLSEVVQASGCTICHCRTTFTGKCRHYYQAVAVAYMVRWAIILRALCSLILTCACYLWRSRAGWEPLVAEQPGDYRPASRIRYCMDEWRLFKASCEVAVYRNPTPRLTYTVFTDSVCSGDYAVPLDRSGWRAVCEVCSGEFRMSLNLEPRTIDVMNSSTPASTIVFRGSQPSYSPVHVRRQDPVHSPDYLAPGGQVCFAYLEYRPELRQDIVDGRWWAVMIGLIGYTLSLFVPTPTFIVSHMPTLSTTALLLATLTAALVGGFCRANRLSLSLSAPMILAYSLTALLVVTDPLDGLRLALFGLLVVMRLSLFAIVYGGVAWMGYCVGRDFTRDLFGWEYLWIRHARHAMIMRIFNSYPIADKDAASCAVSKALAQWTSGKIDDLCMYIKNAYIGAMNVSGFSTTVSGDMPLFEAGVQLYSCLTWSLSGTPSPDGTGFATQPPTRRQLVRMLGKQMKEKPKYCARPGCQARRDGSKWRYGLCPNCTKPTHVGDDWQNGKDFETGLHYLGSLAPIWEVEKPMPNIEVDPKVKVKMPTDPVFLRTSEVVPERKQAGWLIGFGIAKCPPMVTMKTLSAAARAVCCRIARRLTKFPEDNIWAHASRIAYSVTSLMGGLITPLEVRPMTPREWLAGFKPERRQALETALMSYEEAGRCLPLANHKWTKFSAFVKREWLPNFEKTELVPSRKCTCRQCALNHRKFHTPYRQIVPLEVYKPRAINAPEDVTHVVTGPALRTFCHHVRDIWNYQAPVFYGSTKPQHLDDWLNACAAIPRFVAWSDYTMFDCTHSKQTWRVLRELYRRLLPPDWEHYEAFWKVLDAWEAPVGSMSAKRDKIRYQVRYKGRAMNASGRDDTALANAVLNAIAIVLAVTAVDHGTTVWNIDADDVRSTLTCCSVSIVGDDSLVWLPPLKQDGYTWSLNDAKNLSDEIARFGFIAKVGISHRVEDAVFLGNRPYRVDGRWYWAPTIGRRLFKHHCRASVEGDPIAWLRGIALFEAQCYGFVPIIGEMARRVLTLTAGHAITTHRTSRFEGDIEWSERHAPPRPDGETYFHCAVAYTQQENALGWTPGAIGLEDLMAVEELVGMATELPCIISHPALEHIMLVDDC